LSQEKERNGKKETREGGMKRGGGRGKAGVAYT
jgi:hypothetical protein